MAAIICTLPSAVSNLIQVDSRVRQIAEVLRQTIPESIFEGAFGNGDSAEKAHQQPDILVFIRFRVSEQWCSDIAITTLVPSRTRSKSEEDLNTNTRHLGRRRDYCPAVTYVLVIDSFRRNVNWAVSTQHCVPGDSCQMPDIHAMCCVVFIPCVSREGLKPPQLVLRYGGCVVVLQSPLKQS